MPREPVIPTLGILTRTVIPNSVVKKIIPARIRDKNKNDVIFITDDFIEIKEYHSNGFLEHIIYKSDFGSKILSACCFGDASTLIKPEPPLTRGFTDLTEQQSNPMKMDIKPRELVPPKILATFVESQGLSFLFAYHDLAGSLRFKSSSTRSQAFTGGSYRKQPGKHMAVDPTSSILALAPHEGYISLFCLKQLKEIKAELELNNAVDSIPFDPIIKERNVAIKGEVLKMEFLIPIEARKDNKESLVVLVIIASYKGRTRVHRYEWDSTRDIEEFREIGTGHALSIEEQTPLLLIPITISSGFLLVCKTRAFLYGNTSQGCWEPPWPLNLNDEELNGVVNDSEVESSPQERGSSYGAPLWTQWTRPIRRADWLARFDAIYVCREDGVVKYLLFETSNKRPIISKCRVGNLKSNVDLAVACIDNGTGGTWHEDGRESEDVLATGGSMGNGALYRFKGRQNAQKDQTLPSWAPVLDICSVPEEVLSIPITPPKKAEDMVPPYNGQDHLFACIGRGSRHGAVCEIQYGTRVSVSTTLILPDPTFLGLWVLSKLSDNGDDVETLLLVTDPQQTQLVSDTGEAIPLEDFGLDSAAQTIVAGSYSQGIIIQVTHQAIRVAASWSNSPTVLTIEKDIVAAAVDKSMPATLACIRQGSEVSLHLVVFSVEDDIVVAHPLGSPLSLEAEVTSLHLQSNGEEIVALAGSLDHYLQIYLGTIKGGLKLVHEVRLNEYQKTSVDNELVVCNSITMIACTPKDHDGSGFSFLVLCGLRIGKLETYKVVVADEEVRIAWQETCTIGETSVRVTPEALSFNPKSWMGTCTRALVHCDNKLYRFSQESSDLVSADALKSRVWLVDHNELGRRFSSITAIAQPDIWTIVFIDGYTKPTLYSIEDANIHFGHIDPSTGPQVLPRPILIGGTPSRLIYSQRLRRLIVGFNKTVVKDSLTHKGRLHFPMVAVLQPYQNFPESIQDLSPNSLAATVQNIGDSGERILGILEWFPYSDPAKKHHFIVINTIRNRKGQRLPTGRILLYHGQGTDETAPLIGKAIVKQNEPVYAVAAYGTQSLVHCTGVNLVLQELSTSDDGKWKIKQLLTAALPSLGSFISVHEQFIHVTTKAHSVVVYRVSHDGLVPAYGDEVARNTSRHSSGEDAPITFVADTNGTVAGLWRPPYATTMNRSFSIVFEAKMPASITRFCKAQARLRYRHAHDHADTVIGTSLNGAMYQFDVLQEHKWRLLKFVQNLIELSPFVCHIKTSGPRRGVFEPVKNVHLAKHIDGDVLARILRYDRPTPESFVRGIMEEELSPSDGLDEIHEEEILDIAKRRARFEELMARGLGTHNGGDPYARLVDYLRMLLHPVM